tara:strand:+ start:61 stop:909 length:849 start_codon:yes stop_codon:yes gene_type:complete
MADSSPYFDRKRPRYAGSLRDAARRVRRRASPYFRQSVAAPPLLERGVAFPRELGSKALVVGQAASRTGCGVLGGIAERRLARLAGMSVAALWALFGRTNLLPYFPGGRGRAARFSRAAGYTKHEGEGDIFPAAEAKGAAAALCADIARVQRAPQLIVLLGLHVARAFRRSCDDLPEGVYLRLPKAQLMERGSLTVCARVRKLSGTRACWRCRRVRASERTRKTKRAEQPKSSSASAALLLGCRSIEILVLPHPSGVSHVWNDRARVDATAAALRRSIANVR